MNRTLDMWHWLHLPHSLHLHGLWGQGSQTENVRIEDLNFAYLGTQKIIQPFDRILSAPVSHIFFNDDDDKIHYIFQSNPRMSSFRCHSTFGNMLHICSPSSFISLKFIILKVEDLWFLCA